MLASKTVYHLKQLGQHWLGTRIGDLFSYFGGRWQGFVRQLFNRDLKSEDPWAMAMDAAAYAYRPKPLDARVLAVQPAERPSIRNLEPSWLQQIVRGNFEVREVPGNHFTIFEEPHVASLAKCIRTGLRDNVIEFKRAAAG
jgi:thioesterase domain-containing protein